MSGIFKTLVATVLLSVVGAAAGGYWLWMRSDELLRQQVIGRFKVIAPEWNVSIGRALFDGGNCIKLYSFAIAAPGHNSPLMELPEVLVEIDAEAFTERQQVLLQRILIRDAQFVLARNLAGRWNWQDLPPPIKSDMSLPEIELERATLTVQLERAGGAAPVSVVVSPADVNLIPSAKRQYVIRARTQVDGAGELQISEGRLNLDGHSWSIDGEMKGLQTNAELFAAVIDGSPELQAKVAKLEANWQKPTPGEATTPQPITTEPVQTAAAERDAMASFVGWSTDSEQQQQPSILDGLGIRGTFDLNFHAAQRDKDSNVEFKVLAAVYQGQVDNERLPFPLRDVQGKFYCDNDLFAVRELQAINGETRLRLEADGPNEQNGRTFRLSLQAWNLVLDDRLRRRLPPGMRRFYESLRPSGELDGKVELAYTSDGRWSYQNLDAKLKACGGQPAEFPYPIRDVFGTIKQESNILHVQLEGTADRKPVLIKGIVRDAGPRAEVTLNVTARDFSLNEDFLNACKPPLQKALRAMRLQGTADADLVLYRAPGEGQKFQPTIDARFKSCSLDFDGFRYRVDDLAGQIQYRPSEKVWHFKQMTARHDDSQLQGDGWFAMQPEPGRLHLDIATQNTAFDFSLLQALKENLRATWKSLSPSGRCNANVTIDWTPRQPPVVVLPQVELVDAGMVMEGFPYAIEHISGRLAYSPGQVVINSFSGRHDETLVSAKGTLDCRDTASWKLQLAKLDVQNLVADREFRRTLPPGLRRICETIDPVGPLALTGAVDLYGGQGHGVTSAAWNVSTFLDNTTAQAGIELSGMTGELTSRGSWDGSIVKMDGGINLETLTALGYGIEKIEGPYRLNDKSLQLGSFSQDRAQPRVVDANGRPKSEHIKGRAIGGDLSFDADVNFDEQSPYRLTLVMANGKLEEYARQYSPRTTNLRGVLNGWIELRGAASRPNSMSGAGQMQIAPAALYELPIVLQMFKALSGANPDSVAFDYAFLDFDVQQRQFRFNRIDLVGNAVSFRGKGMADFDGRLNLNFYSTMPRNWLNRINIPLVSPLVNQAATGWVGIDVTGHVGDPIANQRPVPVLDDSLRQLLQAFDPSRPGPPPSLRLPFPMFAPPIPAASQMPRQMNGQPRY